MASLLDHLGFSVFVACPTGVLSAEILFSLDGMDSVFIKYFKDYGEAALKCFALDRGSNPKWM